MAKAKENEDIVEKQLEDMTPEELLAYAKQGKENLDAVTKQSNAVIKDLKEKIADKKDLKAPTSLTYEGEKYVFTSEQFTVPNFDSPEEFSSIKAEDAKKNADLIKQLIEKKSGVLVKVKKEETKK